MKLYEELAYNLHRLGGRVAHRAAGHESLGTELRYLVQSWNSK